MENIIFIKSLFCPNYKYFKATYDSLSNNLNYLLMQNIQIDIILIGWIPKIYDEFKVKINILIEILKKSLNITFIPWDKNYGKIELYHQFNNFFKNKKYILYADHDILFDITKTNLSHLLTKIENLFEIYKFSVLTFNQLEDCRHQPCILDDILLYENIEIANSEICIDIAGGCFIIKKTIMHTPKYYHVYGFDEKYLMSCTNNKKNGILLNFYVKHPFDLNDNKILSYKTWKTKSILEKIDTYENYSKENYEIDIEESENFWNDFYSQ
jgi:hypothetical protein